MRRRIAPSSGVIGIDLSAKRAAAVYLPAGWEPGSWDGVEYVVAKGAAVVGRDPWAMQSRIVEVVGTLYEFIHRMQFDARGRERSLRVFSEDYAFALSGNAGMTLGEIGGALKYVCGEDDLLVTPVNVSTARKVLLGKIPPGKGAAKTAVHSVVQRLSPPWGQGSDEGDALVIANAGRSLLGMTAIAIA